MISIKNVHKTYSANKASEAVHAVNNVSFDCKPGRVFALLGPNGSGKTTLLRMIATLMKPNSGELTIAGNNSLTDPENIRRKIGFLTGSAGLHEKLSPRETLTYFAHLNAIPKAEIKSKVEEMIEKFRLEEFLTRATGKLSMGQKQRVMLARTLIHDPEVIVFDEATTGLDVLAAKSLINVIRDCRDAQKTILFSTHIMGEVAMLADDVTILHKGKQIYLGSLTDLKMNQQSDSLEDEFIRLLEHANSENTHSNTTLATS